MCWACIGAYAEQASCKQEQAAAGHTPRSPAHSRTALPSPRTLHLSQFLKELGIEEHNQGVYNGKWMGSGPTVTSYNPANGKAIATIATATPEEYEQCLAAMEEARAAWAETPRPVRGEIVRQIGVALREKLVPLGQLISLEMGKIKGEGIGEVQEFVDVCDIACGLGRTLSGKVIGSERPGHQLLEMWHPVGHVGIISAFNFPCAVYGWNVAISLMMGNCNIWKPATTVSLVAVAVTKLVSSVLEANGLSGAITSLVTGGGATIGEAVLQDKRLKLVSFTGSTNVGRHAAATVHGRFGDTILELGGNNASIVMADADLELALRGSLFGAVGTCGQRCTSLRRLLLQEEIYDDFVAKLVKAYAKVPRGDPLEEGTLLGPLHNAAAVKTYTEGLEEIQRQGGKILAGGNVVDGPGFFVEPTIVEIDPSAPIVNTELFVPILYVFKFKTFEEAVAMNNSVPQGLSSSLYTNNMKHMWKWVGPTGSDCGLVNVNCGTSGAECGGAFCAGNKEGKGSECGSNSWQQYGRRATCSINYSDALPLSQGIKFDT